MKPAQVAPLAEAVEGGFTLWRAGEADVEVLFVGKGPRLGREETIHRVLGDGRVPAIAWLRQVHGAAVLGAAEGPVGVGDGLVTDRRGLGLVVSTADCVPIVMADGERVVALHAGWRGIVAGIVAAGAAELEGQARAWIGPAIGPCCYEVGDDVADALVAASSEGVRRPGPGQRPHVDLVGAVRHQLALAGVKTITAVGACTRCRSDVLWSYRREGSGAGRNLALVWLR